VLTVANFNMHCGIDGWGRPFDFVAACAALEADVLVLEETWLPDRAGDEGQAHDVARALGYEPFTCPLGEGRRIQAQPAATDTWMPRPGMANRNKSLYFHCIRPLPAATVALPRYQEAEPGTLGIAILVRGPVTVDGTKTLHLPQLRRDQIRRAALVIDVTVDGRPLSLAGTHMSHIHMGSYRHWMALRKRLATEARPETVLSGDMNLWGPPVRAFMTGWHRAVKGPSWPSHRPHSQIDHILVRGQIRVVSGEVMPDGGSDHRPVRARLEVS
jgi:endonuclease/exonuclease/phosphatase family metal-dependent hydrolase